LRVRISLLRSQSSGKQSLQKNLVLSYSLEDLPVFSKVGICIAAVAAGLPVWSILATGSCILGVIAGVCHVISCATAAQRDAPEAVLP
jgi:hypothetical protein